METFNLSTAASFLPIMDNTENGTKQLISSILMYNSLLDAKSKPILIDFILTTRLSENAKLRLSKNYRTVEHLVEDMNRHLLAKKSFTAIQQELSQCTQKQKSIEEYGQEIENLFVNLTIAQADGDQRKHAVLKPINEKTAINRFATGLRNTHLSTIITARNYDTLKDAIRAATDEQISLSSRGSNTTDVGTVNKQYSNNNMADSTWGWGRGRGECSQRRGEHGQRGHGQYSQRGRGQNNQHGHVQFNQSGHVQHSQGGRGQNNQHGHVQLSQRGHVQHSQGGRGQHSQGRRGQHSQSERGQHSQGGRGHHNQGGRDQHSQKGHVQLSQSAHVQFSQSEHRQNSPRGHGNPSRGNLHGENQKVAQHNRGNHGKTFNNPEGNKNGQNFNKKNVAPKPSTTCSVTPQINIDCQVRIATTSNVKTNKLKPNVNKQLPK